MSITARVTYNDATTTNSLGQAVPCWRAHIKLAHLNPYQQQLKAVKPDNTGPLTDALTITADTLEQARERTTAAIEALTSLNAYSTRYIDLREHNASPAACEEFNVAREKRAGVQKAA